MQQVLGYSSTLLKCFCLLHQIHAHFYEFTETRGESMLPTLAPHGDFVHVLKGRVHRRPAADTGDATTRGLHMGDCVVLRKPNDPRSRVCKRITGMPGDIIEVDPSYDGDDEESALIEVPKGHVWVTGDNLSYSLDSRSYSAVPLGLLLGKVVAANDFSKPARDPETGAWFGYRRIPNNYIEMSVD